MPSSRACLSLSAWVPPQPSRTGSETAEGLTMKKLVVAGVVFILAKAIADEITKTFDLPDETKGIVSWGAGVTAGKIVHALL